MNDIWVCSSCHSVNGSRADHCYKCGAKQSSATGQGSTLRVATALAARTRVRYRSAWLRGLLASVLILAVTGLGIVLTLLSFDLATWVRDQLDVALAGGRIDSSEYLDRLDALIPIALARVGTLILAIVFFAAWLSRVVSNVPAVGGGIPSTTPTRAFLFPLIPIVNLVKVPGILLDCLYRVDPRGGGFLMIAAAWLGLVGSWLAGFVAGLAIDARVASDLLAARTPADIAAAIRTTFDLSLAVEVVQSVSVIVGSLILIAVMVRIERRSDARDREISGAVLAYPGEVIDQAVGQLTQSR